MQNSPLCGDQPAVGPHRQGDRDSWQRWLIRVIPKDRGLTSSISMWGDVSSHPVMKLDPGSMPFFADLARMNEPYLPSLF